MLLHAKMSRHVTTGSAVSYSHIQHTDKGFLVTPPYTNMLSPLEGARISSRKREKKKAMGWEWGVGAMLDRSGMFKIPLGKPYMSMPPDHGLAWSR